MINPPVLPGHEEKRGWLGSPPMKAMAGDLTEMGLREMTAGSESGGTNTSHTIVVPALRQLLEAIGPDAPQEAYEAAVVEENILGKRSDGGRARTFRYLRELYLLRPDSILFRALRDLWNEAAEAQPLIAGLCALARDSVFRASAPAVLDALPGSRLSSSDLATTVERQFPAHYGEGTLAKIGRNTFSSWEQVGHLIRAPHNTKERVRPPAHEASLAYALLLGYIEGRRGGLLFESTWVRVLDLEPGTVGMLASSASARGLIEFRQAGGMTDIGFNHLMRPLEAA